MITVVLPAHLRTLAGTSHPVRLDVAAPATQRAVFDALEARYPALRGTVRDVRTQRRRPFVRLYAGDRDLSHDAPDVPLPDAVVAGDEPLRIVGAVAGG